MSELGKFLIVSGLILVLLGVAFLLIPQLGLGRLPGDMVFRGKRVVIYFPLATSLLISILLSALLWLVIKFLGFISQMRG